MHEGILIGGILLLGLVIYVTALVSRHRAEKERQAEIDRFQKKLDNRHPRWVDRMSGDIWIFKDFLDGKVLLYKESSPNEILFLNPRTLDEWFEPEEEDDDD